TFRIEIFSNPTCDGSGNGEGQTFVRSASVTTDGACNSSFNVIIPNALQPGSVVTATATDSAGNTSEFSQCTVVGGESCVIACPSNITVNNTPNQCGAIVNYPIPNAGPGCGTVVCKPSPGTFFNVGTTTVNCTLAGVATCSFRVTVK